MALTALLGSVLGARSGRKLGRLLGGSTGAMIGGMAGSLFGGRNLRRIGKLLPGRGESHDDSEGDEDVEPISEDEARVIIRAMCNSAKADGVIDDAEMDAIVGQLEGIDDDDEIFLRSEMKSPFVSAQEIADETPADLGLEVYAVSTMSINVDNDAEAAYLSDLADALGVDPTQLT